MSEGVQEGASLPEGIDVDDTAAYFGVIESSDVLQQLMEMDSKQALSKTLEHLSDVVLQPGEFNFEAASERLQCEGGEIYFLIFGHLNLMSLPDPMLAFAGQPDSTGSTSSAHPLATEEVIDSISVLFDPMQFLKILAIGYSTGGEPEVDRYLTSIQDMMANPSKNLEKIQALAAESMSSLDVAGHALPISLLASEGAEPATIEAGQSMPAQERKQQPVSTPAEPAPVKEVVAEQPVSVPLPTTVEDEKLSSVPLPSFETSVVVEEPPKNDVEADLATQDAFSGAFGTELIPEVEEIIQQPAVEEMLAEEPVVVEPTVQEVVEAPVEEWVSDAERFIAADVDESGALSVEELAVAANIPLDTAEELHKAADSDGDGEVTLSEFVSSDAAKTMSSLPRPVAPIRRPIQNQQNQQQSSPSPGIQAPQAGWQQQPVPPVQQQPVQPAQQQPIQQQPMQQPVQPVQQQQPMQQQPMQQQPMQQQPMQQQPMQQQPGMNIQPTIRSGIHCRGCGIGLDPYWRFCPLCGNMNASAHR